MPVYEADSVRVWIDGREIQIDPDNCDLSSREFAALEEENLRRADLRAGAAVTIKLIPGPPVPPPKFPPYRNYKGRKRLKKKKIQAGAKWLEKFIWWKTFNLLTSDELVEDPTCQRNFN